MTLSEALALLARPEHNQLIQALAQAHRSLAPEEEFLDWLDQRLDALPEIRQAMGVINRTYRPLISWLAVQPPSANNLWIYPPAN